MTMAVVALFPWGPLAPLFREPGARVQQAVIFAVDSRFTRPVGNRDERTRTPPAVLQDDGTKLYRVANNAMVVYSGDVIAAQHAVREIRKYFGRRPRGSQQDAAGYVARIIRAVYDQEKQLAHRGQRPTPAPARARKG
jgi:hypothetical protein